jgi:hypothetical protein
MAFEREAGVGCALYTGDLALDGLCPCFQGGVRERSWLVKWGSGEGESGSGGGWLVQEGWLLQAINKFL